MFREAKPLVTSVMDGYNVCIFAYGQTGAGKTHTMEGPCDDRGVNHRALAELFRLADERADGYEYAIVVSMMEVYNEQVRDLLDDAGARSAASPSAAKGLEVRLGPGGGSVVPGLQRVPVRTVEDVLQLMARGAKNRHVGGTAMNADSSRSHCVLSVEVTGLNTLARVQYQGKLQLIDLAGSERIDRSGATGERLKEAQCINKSLSTLGDVLQALAQKQKHVPFRNSKLTFLLADSLRGQSKVRSCVFVEPARGGIAGE